MTAGTSTARVSRSGPTMLTTTDWLAAFLATRPPLIAAWAARALMDSWRTGEDSPGIVGLHRRTRQLADRFVTEAETKRALLAIEDDGWLVVVRFDQWLYGRRRNLYYARLPSGRRLMHSGGRGWLTVPSGDGAVAQLCSLADQRVVA